jgi:hypothetical protein
MVKAEKIICNRGAAAVETAFVILLFLLLSLGVIQYGWLFLKSQQITNAARHGARIAILNSAAQDYVESEIKRLMAKAGMAQSKSEYVVTYPLGNIGSVPVGQPLEVEITVPCAKVAIIKLPVVNGKQLLPIPDYLKASVTMAKEGP